MRFQDKKSLLLACFVLLVLYVVATTEADAQSNQLVLEKEKNWETYGVGGTCISGVQNLAVADVDDDGFLEIITGGSMYLINNGTQTPREAPLRIWNWNGKNLTLEKGQNWSGSIGCVATGDANGDGTTEIVTGGTIRNDTGSYSQINIWQWNDQELVLKSTSQGTSIGSVSSIFVSDVGGVAGSTPYIFTVGRYNDLTGFSAQLSAWRWDGSTLALKNTARWGASNSTSANSLSVYDLDDDGWREIATGGYANMLKNSSGQLRVWHWNGEEFSLVTNEEWYLRESGYGLTNAGGVMGNTVVSKVKIDDVDDDGTSEIVTGGFAYDGEKVGAQLRIWNWNGQILNLEKSQEWATQDIVQIPGVSINDVNRDGRKEIITSGVSAASGSFYSGVPEKAQLRVWNWDGQTLTLKNEQDWYIDNGAAAYHVASGDLDKDGVNEIVTVGCTYFGTMCDPDMRIWSVAAEPALPSYLVFAAVGITLIIVAAVVVFLLVKIKRK